MFVYSMVLCAANPKEPFIFDKDKEKKDIIKETVKVCNNSTNFKRTGKTIEIIEFQNNSLTVELKSKAPIENPTLSLRGFSRAIIKTEKFRNNMYRASLFNAREIKEKKEHEDIDDISVVQKVIELFMSRSNNYTEAKEKIRQIIKEL